MHELIIARQSELQIGDDVISAALGYPSIQVIALIKAGRMALPINKVTALSQALNLDASVVLRKVMGERAPGLLDEIEAIIDPLGLTTAESDLIRDRRARVARQQSAGE